MTSAMRTGGGSQDCEPCTFSNLLTVRRNGYARRKGRTLFRVDLLTSTSISDVGGQLALIPPLALRTLHRVSAACDAV